MAVTGDYQGGGFIDTTNSAGKGFRLIDSRLDAVDGGLSYQIQDWPMRVVDRDGRTVFVSKYYKNTDGSSSGILAEITYSSESDQIGHWAQIAIGHDADGKAYFETGCPTSFGSDVTATGKIKSESQLSAPALYLGGTGAHIVRQLNNIQKGTSPSSNVYVGNFLYGNGTTNATSARLAGNEIGIGTQGNTTYTFSCFKNEAGSTEASTLRLGYSSDGPYVNITADNINVSGQLNASGDVVCSSSATFRGTATVNFVHDDTVIDVNSNPTSNQQRWPLAIYDKNGAALAYCKFTKETNGNKQWAFVVAHPKSSGSGNNLDGLIVNCDVSGKYSTLAVNADSDSNSTDIATTFWVRRYMWDASEAQVVHTVNDETISGSKTFTNAIRGGATTLIQSVPWEGVSIADSSRDSTVNRMMAVILDKDSKRFAGLEAAATSSGQRYVHISMRRRDDSGWVSPFKAVELPDGTTYCEGSHHPPAGDNSYKLATTGWVVSQLSSAVPTGAIMFFAQNAVPSGWLLCNGANVSRTTYANLFAVIGTRHGAGNGSTTFTLPNLNDRFAEGTTTTNNVGQVVQAGLPNITGAITGYDMFRNMQGAGPFFDDTSTNYFGLSRPSGGHSHNESSAQIAGFQASRSSSIYGASSTVQPPAVRLLPCIKA